MCVSLWIVALGGILVAVAMLLAIVGWYFLFKAANSIRQ